MNRPLIQIVADMQSKLTFSSDLEAVINNRQHIDDLRKDFNEQLKVIDALRAANQSLCKHPNATSYSDPRDSGWACKDCGASR